MTKEEAIEIVVNAAFNYAGEIGFSDQRYAEQLWEAAKTLRPDLEPKHD